MAGPVLPPGWVEARDPNTGRIYYANPTTKESSWELPVLGWHHQQQQPQQQEHHQQHHGFRIYDSDDYSQQRPSNSTDFKSSLITMARELTIQQAADAANDHSSQNDPDAELHSITCGQLVDLLHMQADDVDYTPINPYNIPDQSESAQTVLTDVAIDSKLDILFTQLQEFGYQKR